MTPATTDPVALKRGPLADSTPASSRAPSPKRLPPTPALDGLRGLAIAAVALFHFPTRSVFMGGLFGVGIFFVLSGFLITTILEHDFARDGRIKMGEFLRRRAWRLLPALVVFLVAIVAATAAFGDRGWFTSDPFGPGGPGSALSVTGALKGAAAGVTYTYNLFLAHSTQMPAPFGHLWTLAVEGQFYVLWALSVAALLRFSRGALMGATVFMIGLSAVIPFLLWDHGNGQNYIYFDTIPRIQQLLAGSLLAQLWSGGSLSRVPTWLLRAGAAAGGAVITWMVLTVANVPFKYLGSLTVVAGGGALILANLVDQRTDGFAQNALRAKPLVWLGQRSYAVYLWHWPLADWTNMLPHRIGVPLGIGCTLIAAELSWRLVERPSQLLSAWLRRRRSYRTEPAVPASASGSPWPGWARSSASM